MIQAALHLAAAVLLCLLTGQTTLPIVVVALLLSLAPDLDTPKSLIGALCPPLSRRIERTVGHRTITHSLLALALVAGVAYLLAPAYWLVLAGAYASHLLLDLLIGVQGITLFWPTGEWFTLAAWRNDGRAPRALLVTLLCAVALVALWPTLAPTFSPQVSAALNPLATPKPTPATPTPVPPITLHLALPAGVGLSALRVHVGDTLHEGQLLARWEAATPIPQQSPTAPVPLPTPAAIPLPLTDSSVLRGVAEAAAALQALTTAQSAERAALLAAQQRQRADLQRRRDDAQRALDQLQPQHERTQAEAQHAVSQAHQAFLDAQAAASLADPADAPATQRATERVHAAAATLEAALDAQDRMRAEQGIERAAAETAGAQAQADLDALPAQQRQALATLDADQRAAQLLARTRIDSARSQAADAQRAHQHDSALADASATAAAHAWQADVTATAQAHAEAATATAAALPTPAPNQLVSRASGRVVSVSAEEQNGQLVVTLELVP
jgi:membrane-bound metal-dependent hydrolase YbcI (DUF457 family)